MSQAHEPQSQPATDRTEEPLDPKVPDSESAAHAREVSAEAAAKIDNIDEILDDWDETNLVTLGFKKGEKVSAAEWEKAARIWNEGFKQKGGQ